MPPHVLVDPDDIDSIEAAGIIDQQPFTLGQDRVVRGVPCHRQGFGHAGHRQVLNHDAFQGPPQPALGQFRPGSGCSAGVLTPHMPAFGAFVTAHHDLERGWAPPKRFMRQTADHRATDPALTPTPAAPLVRGHNPAPQYRPDTF